MFGYVRIYKDELKVKDYNLFRAYYCGLCQTIKKEYGFPARYFLSYDASFLAVFLSAINSEETKLSPIRCLANPTIRRPAVEKDDILSYAAAVNVLLVWFKLQDDWADNHSPKAAFLMPFMAGKRNKAKKRYPLLYQKIHEGLSRLSALEKAGCAIPDEAAEAFGQLMGDVFQTTLIGAEHKRRILGHCGLLLGRFIYLLDAWADRYEDKKKHAYNPFLLAEPIEEVSLKTSLEYTLSELASSMQLLQPEKNQEILNNIIYLGLKKALDNVFEDQEIAACSGAKEKHHERPL